MEKSSSSGDSIDDLPMLPTDNNSKSDEDYEKLKNFLDVQQKQKMGLTAKEVGMATVLFIILCLPIIDRFIYMFIPAAENSSILNCTIKAAIFFLILYVLVHPWSKNKN